MKELKWVSVGDHKWSAKVEKDDYILVIITKVPTGYSLMYINCMLKDYTKEQIAFARLKYGLDHRNRYELSLRLSEESGWHEWVMESKDIEGLIADLGWTSFDISLLRFPKLRALQEAPQETVQ